jgi:hypothetical protein
MKLSKTLTSVTPFSKYLAMFLFILFPFVGFYLGMRYQQIVKINNSAQIVLGSGNFNGSWSWTGAIPEVNLPASGDKTPPSFGLDLIQNGNSLSGDYCAVSTFASKLDCYGPDKTGEDMSNIKGTIKNNVATLVFKDHRTDETNMMATVTDINNRLHWHLEKGPADLQDLVFPEDVYLAKVSK